MVLRVNSQNIIVFKSAGWWIARDSDRDIQVQGSTVAEAIDRLQFLIKATDIVAAEKT